MDSESIAIFYESISYDIDHVDELKLWIQNTSQSEGFSLGEISIILTTDDYLLGINQEYLNHNTLTDIVTFDYTVDSIISGDIFISLERVQENASKYGESIRDELHRVIIHGILHLCGYTDKQAKAKAEMTEKEDYYLSLRTF